MYTFKSSNFKIFKNFLVGTLISGFLILAIFALLMNFNETNRDMVFLLTSIGAFLCGAIFAYLTFSKIIVDENSIKFYHFSKLLKTIDINEPVVTSYIVKHSTNGIPTSTDFNIRVQNESMNRPKDHKCKGFNKSTFQEMMAKIYQIRSTSEQEQIPEEDAVVYTDETYEFIIPKEEIILKTYKRQTLLLIVFIIMFLIIAFPMIFIGVTNEALDSHFNIIVGFAILLFIMLIGLPYLTFKRKIKRINMATPSSIGVSDQSIKIDDTIFQVDEIQSIRVTPPSYATDMNINKDRTILFTYQGRSYKFLFGTTTENLGKYEAYPELCDAIEDIFKKRNIFIFKL